ncbi:MAG TPA: hypothetical protein VEL31_20610 [Ktedonobacteraceae bacterium]|nr:hypothetical protein [Ktedonobacteraceae bacterium]
MSKQKHKTKPGLSVKTRSGRRTFAYQVPPEVVDRLPPGVTVALRSFTREELLALARQAEPQVLRRLVEQPVKNPLEALLLLVEEVYGFLQGKGLPIPHTQRIELARLLATGYDFTARWPYSRTQMQAAMTPGHPDLRPDLPDEHVLAVAEEVEQFLIAKLAQESVTFRDPTQAGMTLVHLTHDLLFGKSAVFGADHQEMYHVARVLTQKYTFSAAWPYSSEQVRAALVALFKFEEQETREQ